MKVILEVPIALYEWYERAADPEAHAPETPEDLMLEVLALYWQWRQPDCVKHPESDTRH